MSGVALTGADGFLGHHTRAALQELAVPVASFKVGDAFDLDRAAAALSGTHRAVHLAGVNRATDTEVAEGNVIFARQFADALRRAEHPPAVVVFANSVQADNRTVYGTAKAAAADVLAAAAAGIGAQFVDLRLPNLFGEHGRPFYNAVTSTFCTLLAEGGTPQVEQDRDLTLLHAQNAADLLVGSVAPDTQADLEEHESVSGLLGRLTVIADTYRHGEIPDLSTSFDRDLFNTYRSYTVDRLLPFPLTRHADARGSFFEILRSHGGTGQSSFSTTVPGITRGDHFHRRKVERFTVLSGRARISLRQVFTGNVRHVDVDGDAPVAVDMPTMWAHRIANTGADTLFTSFWTDDIFDPARPDTIAEVV